MSRVAGAQEGAPRNPRGVGEAIAAALPEHPAIASTSIAGPGFVNLVLREDYVAGRINDMMRNGIATWAPSVKVARHPAALNGNGGCACRFSDAFESCCRDRKLRADS